MVSKLSGLGTFLAPQRPGAYRLRGPRDARSLRPRALPVRLELPDREALDGICRAHGRAPGRGRPRRRGAKVFGDTARRVYRLGHDGEGGPTMALEIKILDYGDIELESSFLVLGRDCGRTRRVPTYGFLILGGALAGGGRYRLPPQPDHGDPRHARAPVPREHDREPARPARRAHGRRALRAAHASAHRPCRQGRALPDEHHGDRQPARAGIFRLGPDAPAIPGARHQAPDRPAAHARRAAASRISNCRARSSSSRAATWSRPAPTPRAR